MMAVEGAAQGFRFLFHIFPLLIVVNVRSFNNTFHAHCLR